MKIRLGLIYCLITFFCCQVIADNYTYLENFNFDYDQVPYVPLFRRPLCCNGTLVINPKLNQRCCNKNTLYNSDEAVCCNGKLIYYDKFHPFLKCCYGRVFNPLAEVCCAGVKSIKLFPIPTKPIKYICCRGNLLISPPDTVKCCGGNTYNLKIQRCCKNVILNSGGLQSSDALSCCDGALYNRITHGCCQRTIIPKLGNTQRCCGKQLYDTTDKSIKCCADYVCNATTTVAHCGNQVYDNRVFTCCKYQVFTGKLSCCGGLGYDPNKQICCRNFEVKDRPLALKTCDIDCWRNPPREY